ncbi:MAG: molybdopterin-dependent oxidoreductase [Marinicaulis sp.]|nr:molybdopterin-dependent oxidoreductase [Marinicaulis sp.]
MTKSVSAQTVTRRTAIAGGFAGALGAPIPFGRFLPTGMTPIALAQKEVTGVLADKPGLKLLSDRPLNAETPPHLLDDEITPSARMFVRNNGLAPIVDEAARDAWRLTIDGEVETPLSVSLEDLKNNFETHSFRLQIECGGNGRRFMTPPARGNQWSFGAISCASWTGVRLRDVLQAAGLKQNAVYTGHEGADLHLSGDREKLPLSRGVPIAKALEPHTLVAFAVNDGDIPLQNGYPLRLVAPGWPGSCSQKMADAHMGARPGP